MHQSCYCNTGSLWKERVFIYFLTCSFRLDIYGAKSKLILYTEGGATDFVFCGVYSGEEDDLSSSKGHRNTQSNLRERLTNISDEIIVKKKEENNELDKSNNDNNNNRLKIWVVQEFVMGREMLLEFVNYPTCMFLFAWRVALKSLFLPALLRRIKNLPHYYSGTLLTWGKNKVLMLKVSRRWKGSVPRRW